MSPLVDGSIVTCSFDPPGVALGAVKTVILSFPESATSRPIATDTPESSSSYTYGVPVFLNPSWLIHHLAFSLRTAQYPIVSSPIPCFSENSSNVYIDCL